MAKPPIAITTIYPQAEAIRSYAKMGFRVILIGDKKTPNFSSKKNIEFYSIADQKKLFPEFYRIAPYNHYSRKNFGYLIALKNSSEIIETDDDSYPYDFFPNFVREKKTIQAVASKNKFVNTFSLFLNKGMTTWPRGYPLRLINTHQELHQSKITGIFPLQQSLIDRDSDVDAIYRLTNNREVTFMKNKMISCSPHTYAPLNTQNTYWRKEAFLLMYVPCFVPGRVTDIYRGYIAQRLLWEMGYTALFLSPSMYQIRNPHDYIKDFKEEITLFTSIEEFVDILERVRLSGSIENKMLQIYNALIKYGFFPLKELEALKIWIRTVVELRS